MDAIGFDLFIENKLATNKKHNVKSITLLIMI
jgi:hypothetical protein